MTARVLALLPELTDVNGDAQNALVLARRAGWAGIEAEVVPVLIGGDPGPTPALVVLGSTTDPALPRLLDALLPLRDALVRWIDAGVPVLAVGTGMEALGSRITTAEGVLDGLGILPGASLPLPARAVGDLVVHGDGVDLVGYENHSRGFRLDPGARPLGSVVRGTGDGVGLDGVRHGSILGTRLHGPVLAKNPGLADAMLALAFGEGVRPIGAAEADAVAARIRAALGS